MAKFRVGQRVEVLDSLEVPAIYKCYVGLIATIIRIDLNVPDPRTWYRLDYYSLTVREDHLRPVDDRGSWDEITRLIGFDIRTGRPQHA